MTRTSDSPSRRHPVGAVGRPGGGPFPAAPVPRRALFLCAALAFLLPLLLFLPAVQFELLNLDDTTFVVGNRIVVRGLSLSNLRDAFLFRSPAPMYIPVLWISYMLDATLFGTRPWGFHLSNVLLHATNGLLLFFLLRTLAARFLRPSAPRPVLAPLLLSLLWSLHPLRVESVAWVAERKDCLAVFFCLLVLLAWLPAVAADAPPRRRLTFGALALLAFLLGIFAKPSLVPLPVILAILACPPFRPRPKFVPLALALLPFCAAAALAAWATASVHATATNVPVPPLGARLATIPSVFFFYIGKILCPVHLAVIYPRWTSSPATGLVLALPLAVAAVWVFVRRNARPLLWLGSALAVLFFLPVSGIVHIPFNLVADRYTCLPAIGLSMAILDFVHPRPGLKTLRPLWLVPAVLLVLLALFTAASAATLPVWRTTSSVFLPVRRLAPNHPTVRAFDVLSARQRGLFSVSHACARRFFDVSPFIDYEVFLFDAVNVGALEGPDAALSLLLAHPPPPTLHAKWAEVAAAFQIATGRDSDALSTVAAALPSAPATSAQRTRLLSMAMFAAHRLHRTGDALRYARLTGIVPPNATELLPAHFLPFYVALWNADIRAPALDGFRSLAAGSNDPVLLNNISWLLASSFQSPAPPSEAVDLARRALDILPANSPLRPSLLDTLSVALANDGQFEAAASAVSEALEALPPRAESRTAMQRRLDLYRRGLPYREILGNPVPPGEYAFAPAL